MRMLNHADCWRGQFIGVLFLSPASFPGIKFNPDYCSKSLDVGWIIRKLHAISQQVIKKSKSPEEQMKDQSLSQLSKNADALKVANLMLKPNNHPQQQMQAMQAIKRFNDMNKYKRTMEVEKDVGLDDEAMFNSKTYAGMMPFYSGGNLMDRAQNVTRSELSNEEFYNEIRDESDNEDGEDIECLAKADPEDRVLVVIDDFIAQLQTMDGDAAFLEMLLNRRKMFPGIVVSYLFTGQRYKYLPLSMRVVLDFVIALPISRKDFVTIAEEHTYKKMAELVKIVEKHFMDNPHNFIFFNLKSNRLFLNFERLLS